MAAAAQPWAIRNKFDRADSTTRAQLLDAARQVFASRGYARTTVADITGTAGVGRATFYVYFASKQEVFGVLAADIRDRFLAAQELSGLDPADYRAVAEATNAAYLDAYTENLALITVLEHQSIAEPELHALWEEIHAHPRRRTARYIQRLVDRGVARPAAPAEDVSRAAGGMVAAFAPVVADDPSRRAAVVAHLTAMFLRLLGVDEEKGIAR
jgi:AcrR family transcriptional regulator